MPLFTFGRASAKISSAKAKENATRMSIGIEKNQMILEKMKLLILFKAHKILEKS